MSIFSIVPQADWLVWNELAFALSDQFPVSKGHSLVVVRREIATWWETTQEEQFAILELVAAVKLRLDIEHAPDGYNVGFNSGDAAGQTIPHLHLHVIPRYVGDSPDPRGGVRHVIPHLANYLKPSSLGTIADAALVTPSGGRLYLELTRCLLNDTFDRIDLLVSFVMRSGIELIASRLDDALARGAHIRLLTTDYLDVTDVGALGFFLDRLGSHPSGGRLEARVFCDPATSFHPKAYIFSSGASRFGVAFVGSSNLSHSGLKRGVEWNIETRAVAPLLDEFDRLWADKRSVTLTAEWLHDYQLRKQDLADRKQHTQEPEGDEQSEPTIVPWSVQGEALAALTATRIEGNQAGLVVMATGLGKTWLAAFDSTRPEFRRVLFVAHREEILTQARDVYRRIRPDGSFTFFTGNERDPSGDVVFASIQSLQRNLASFKNDSFDYIVVDEFHHASAPTYRKMIGHFEPRFLLGLTATPDRVDAADLLALCGDNLVYDCGLIQGIERGLLSQFRYRAIRDVADYADIPWRSGRFDVEALTRQLETQQRSAQIFKEWAALNGSTRRSLGFCCSIAHAEYMATYFQDHGVQAVAVHSGSSSASRADALTQLETGAIRIVFSVDLFNEGVDIPTADIVLMLRPTESPIVFFQQLGRGLRRADGKSHLDVLDLVGNHRSFLLKARLLAGLAGHMHLTDYEAVEFLRKELTELPDGCSILVDLDAVDLLAELAGAPKPEDRLAELVRVWTDEHDGKRPRALELALITKRSYDMKKAGGWFGLLNRLGALSPAEQAAYEIASPFLIDIEHGSYTKSYKLVTLRALIDMDALRGEPTIRDIALASRWQMFRDPRLLADLEDAASAFLDLARPTEAEWSQYWRRNPINALTGGNKGANEPWFKIEGESLILQIELPDNLGSTFDEMVDEIVEYRIHRYLAGREATRVGERRKPLAIDGRQLDATFIVESRLGEPVSIFFESAGGAGSPGKKRNTEYVGGVDVVLLRLAGIGAVVMDAYVDSSVARSLPISDRRLDPGAAVAYPIDLKQVGAVEDIRKALLASMSKVARRPTAAKGGGNPRKAMRLVLGPLTNVTSAALADHLAGISQMQSSTGVSVEVADALGLPVGLELA